MPEDWPKTDGAQFGRVVRSDPRLTIDVVGCGTRATYACWEYAGQGTNRVGSSGSTGGGSTGASTGGSTGLTGTSSGGASSGGGTFACGPTLFCDPSNSYCEHFIADIAVTDAGES